MSLSLTFSNESSIQCFNVTILDDGSFEAKSEAFFLTLEILTAGDARTGPNATVVIEDNEGNNN